MTPSRLKHKQSTFWRRPTSLTALLLLQLLTSVSSNLILRPWKIWPSHTKRSVSQFHPGIACVGYGGDTGDIKDSRNRDQLDTNNKDDKKNPFQLAASVEDDVNFPISLDYKNNTHFQTNNSAVDQRQPLNDDPDYSSLLLSTRTSFQDALQLAHQNARFLICYYTREPKVLYSVMDKYKDSRNMDDDPCSGNIDEIKKSSPDQIILSLLLHPKFLRFIQSNPLSRKRKNNSSIHRKRTISQKQHCLGSFYLWICTDSQQIERSRQKFHIAPPKKQQHRTSSPLLLILYPRPSPQLVAHHLCHPPPHSLSSLISWLSQLRYRHRAHFSKLQHLYQERLYLRERKVGYLESVQHNAMQEEQERQERQLEQDKREKEQREEEQRVRRRKMLLEKLPPEPVVGEEGVTMTTVALRFSVGSSGSHGAQRRFDAKRARMKDVFDWIEAVHGMEREKIVLSTMNGRRRFVYDSDMTEDGSGDGESREAGKNMTLEKAGFGKMMALRVIELENSSSNNSNSNSNSPN